MEFEQASEQLFKDSRQKKYTNVRLKKSLKEAVESKGYKVQTALEWFLVWEETHKNILKAMAVEIKRLADRIDELIKKIEAASNF